MGFTMFTAGEGPAYSDDQLVHLASVLQGWVEHKQGVGVRYIGLRLGRIRLLSRAAP